MADSYSAGQQGLQVAIALEKGELTAAVLAQPDGPPRPCRVPADELPPLVRQAKHILVYSEGDWQQAVLQARIDQAADHVAVLGPVTAILIPWLASYRWPAVLGQVGLKPGGAERLFELCRVLTDHARGAPAKLRALWRACLSPAQAEVVGLEGQAASGADLAVIAAAAFRESTPPRQHRKPQPVSLDEVVDLADAVFAKEGGLAKAHPAFQLREGQRLMARRVAEALVREEILLAEAGTGIGKSLAYLVPAALWALAGRRPIVVATFTRNLQDQLRDRDVPILKAALGRELDVLVVKGRSNYPCVRRLLDRLEEAAGSLFHEGLVAVGFLASWAIQAPGSDLESVSPEVAEVIPDLADAVEDVRAHYHTCSVAAGLPCPTEQCCALRRLRSAAERADIIITNQALLMADLSRDLLPDYRYLVIDEAHHLEDAATAALTASVGSTSLAELGRWLMGEEHGRGVARALTEAERLLGAPTRWSGEEEEAWQAWLDAWAGAVMQLEEAVMDLLLDGREQPDEPLALLLDTAARASSRWAVVEERTAALASLAAQGAQTLHAWAARLNEKARENGIDITRSATTLASTATALAGVAATLERIISGDAADVAWAEAGPERRGICWSLCAAPVEVADALAEKLYQPLRSIILTGATLTADRSFAFLRRACGLDAHAHRVVELQVPSPFDWERRLLLCLPKDVPDPGSDEHERTVIETIRRMAKASGGGLLALFTARRRMLSAFKALEDSLRAAGLSVLCQDVSGERWWLMEQMRADPRTVVFGVRSFWEGVDVPGQHLRCVVVEKLPFAVPDEPLVVARTRHLDEQGLDGYNSYYVPEAIRALRQGVGRVLRTAEDYGVVFILDPRIHTRPYGRRFLRSLPPATLCVATLEETLARAKEWLSKTTSPSEEEPPRCR